MEAFKQLKISNPGGRFWIKIDGCDINPALQESVKGVWNGDCDLGNDKLQQLREAYDKRRELCSCKCLQEDRVLLQERLTTIIDHLEQDTVFLSDGLIGAEKEYQKKFNAPNSSEAILKRLCWERVEFNTLLLQSGKFKDLYENLVACLNPQTPRVKDVVDSMKNIEKDALTYLRNLFVKKRQPAATHILLFLLSDEKRNRKPYAIPIQYIPYHSIKDQFVRDMSKDIKVAMTTMGLKPVGKFQVT